MSASSFNSLGGFSVSIPPIQVVDSNGNIISNVFTSGNVFANVIYGRSFLYANGAPLSFSVAGSNTQVQFNNNSALGASPYFTFDSVQNLLTTLNFDASGNVNIGNLVVANISGNGSGLSSITGANVTGQVNYASVANSVAGANVSGAVNLSTYATTANAVAGANVFGAVGLATYATTANLVAGANVSGQVSNSIIAGTVYTNAQPNITSIGTLSSLDVSGNVSANYFIGNGSALTGITVSAGNSIVNGNSNVAISPNSNVTITVAGTVDVITFTNTGANLIGTLLVTGNANVGNIGATNGVFANISGNGSSLSSITGANVSGAVGLATYATTANAVAGANVSGQVNYAAIANSVAGANVSGQVANSSHATIADSANAVVGANVSGQVNYAAIANSVAGANVSGAVGLATYATTANAVAGANVSGQVANSSHAIIADSANAVAGANVSGAVNLSTYATTANAVAGANVSGAVNLSTYATTANAVAGANVSGAVNLATYATTANLIAGANVSGQVNYAAIANSVAGANVSGQVANSSHATIADSANLIAGANVSGQVGNALVAGTVYTAAQPNITSVGTLTSLAVTGNANVGNLGTSGNISAGYFIGNGSQLTGITANATGIANGNSSISIPIGNANINFSSAGNSNVVVVTGTGANISGTLTATGNISGNYFIGNGSQLTGITATANSIANGTSTITIPSVNGNINFSSAGNANILVVTGTGINVVGTGAFTNISGNGSSLSFITGANVSGQVGNALVAGTVYTAAQPNITSVGTLTSLAVTGNANVGNIGATFGVFTNVSGNGSSLSSITGANVSGAVSYATTANAVAGANVSGAVNLSTYATTANAVAGANVSGQVGNALVAGTVYTAAQPNITSVGTLTSLAVSGNANAGNIGATFGVFTNVSGNGSSLSSITGANVSGAVNLSTYATTANAVAGANVSGQVGNALVAGTVYTAAQPNITSVGTLTSLAVSGNANAGNIGATRGVFTSVFGDGGNLSNIQGANVSGAINLATYATTANSVAGANVSGQVSFAATANLVAGANVSGAVNLSTYATTANAVAGANVSGQVNYAAIANSVAGANVSGQVANSSHATIADSANAVAGANVSGAVGLATYATTANAVAGANVSGQVSFAATANLVAGGNVSGAVGLATYATTANAVAGANVSGQVGNALVAGTVYTAAQPNITSVGTLTSLTVTGNSSAGNISTSGILLVTGNASVGNLTTIGNVSAGNLLGNGSLITGLSLGNSLSDVSVSGISLGQLLGWNGTAWVNTTNSPVGSAGQGISFWPESPTIITTGTNNIIPVLTYGTTPVTSGETLTVSATPNSNTVPLMAAISTPLGRTVLDPGQWTFDLYVGVNNAGGTTTMTHNIYQVVSSTASSITLTVTGTGTSRTLTASSSFFSTAIASATNTVADYIQTPQGLYQITAKTSNTVVTISVPSTYTNETAVSGYLWHNLFGVTSSAITAITPNYGLYTTQTTQASFSINTTDALGKIAFATSSASKTVTFAYNGTTYASNVLTPLITLHNGLGGIQGGSANQYYHLTSTEYTGTGSGTFVRATSPMLTSPNIDNATGKSLVLTNSGAGNLTADNANLGNIASANYFRGSGNNLSNIQGANVSGAVGLATYATTANAVAGANVSGQVGNALVAGTVYTAAQPNITSVGTLTSLAVTGNVNAGNISTVGILSVTGNANVGNIGATNGVFTSVSGDGGNLSNITGANVSGAVSYATTANAVAGTNVSGQVGNALVAGTVYTAAQPNITSVGTLTSLAVSGDANILGNLNISSTTNIVSTPGSNGNITLGPDGTGIVQVIGNINANYFVGNGTGLSSLSGANVSGQVGNALVAGTVYTAAQPNITSVGTLTSLAVSGDANVGNLGTSGNISAGYFIGNGSQLTGITPTLTQAIRTVTANTTINVTDQVILANGTITLTLPLSSSTTGNTFFIKNIGTGQVTVNCTSTDTIDKYSNIVLQFKNSSFEAFSSGTGTYYIF
jgi:hypothetical protein